MNPKKKQEKSKFARLQLRSTASSSKKTVSPNPREKISSYFSSENPTESPELFTSGAESQFGQKFSSDEDDFSKPKSVKPKVFEIKVPKDSKRKRTRNKNDLTRFVKNMGPSCSDTNTEHLQLALAISKSLEENPAEESPYPSTQQKLATLKSTLDQFGFKTDRGPIEMPVTKTAKQKKKLKFLTPTLYLRTEEDRAKLIETKVSGILSNIAVYNKYLEETEARNNNEQKFINNKPNSFLLRDYYDEESTLFRINNLSISEMNNNKFYNKTVSREIVETGVLLKNWRSIPGRETTPPRYDNIIVEETEEIVRNQEEEEAERTQEEAERAQKEATEQTQIKETGTSRKSSSLISETIIEGEQIVDNEINIIVEETEEILQESGRNTEINAERLYPNSPAYRSFSPDLFSESESELGINNKTPPNHQNSSQINNITNLSPIIILSSNKNSPFLSEKEIFSDDSDAISLSLLDSISPKRNKGTSPKKRSPMKKSPRKLLFIRETKNTVDTVDFNSPIKSLEDNTQICHYESFHDNDYFRLSFSSDDSNKNVVVSEHLFAETVNEIGGHDDNYSAVISKQKDVSPPNEFVDLTQSSNEARNNSVDDSNDSVKTVLLKPKNYDTNILEKSSSKDKNVANDYSPEFDILNSSNNKDFYQSLSIISDSDSDHNNTTNKNMSKDIILKKRSLSPNISIETTPKNKSFKKSFSENIIGETEFKFASQIGDKTDFFKLSSPLNVTNMFTQPCLKSNYELISENTMKENIDLDKFLDEIDISDEEINYSVYKSKRKHTNLDDISLSIETCSDVSDEELNYSTNNSSRIQQNINIDDDVPTLIDFNDLPHTGFEPEILKHPRVQHLKTPNTKNNVTPEKNNKTIPLNITPNNDFIIKTYDVTPMPNYNEMSSPLLRKELDKYGIRPLKRAKGIKMLQYIYEATHPVVQQNLEKTANSSSDEEDNRIIKRRKKSTIHQIAEKIECLGNGIANCERVEDMIFERKQSVKIASCRLPLHIAWHNLVSSNRELHEKILIYEPIQVEEIYAKFKSLGYKFHIQDIISFLDKKCITIRVAQKQNQKQSAGL